MRFHPFPCWRPIPWAVWGLVVGYSLLALAYNLAVPPFEPSDEFNHFRFVRYLIENHQLPVFEPTHLSEYHQPPLYYLISAAIAWPWPAHDLPAYVNRLNPHRAYRHWEPGVDNKNVYLHGPWDDWPLANTSLALHMARLASWLTGLVTVVLTYQMAGLIFGESVALTAAGMVALTPMFLAVTGSLQNDAGATALGALILWLTVCICLAGVTARRAFGLGVAIGLGGLMKITAVFLLAPVALALGLWLWRQRVSVRRGSAYLALLMMGALVSGGWWYVRNILLYGEITGVNINLNTYGRRSLFVGLAEWPASFEYAWTNLWGRFGHGEVVMSGWIYLGLGLVSCLALIGLVRSLWRRADQTTEIAIVFLIGAILVEIAGLMVYFTLSPTGANSRYAFPALSAFMAFWAVGLLTWLPERWRAGAVWGVWGAMAGLSLVVLGVYILPAYRAPPILQSLPTSATARAVPLGDLAVLKGYEVSTTQAHPGERVYVTVYWEPLRQTARPYSVYVHLYYANHEKVAQRDTYPGLGRYATTAWIPGGLFADRYLVLLPKDFTAPAVAYWEVGLWQVDTGERAMVLDRHGQPTLSGVQFGQLNLLPISAQTSLPAAAQPLDATFSDIARLHGYEISVTQSSRGEVVDVTLYWEPLRQTELPYSVYVHLLDNAQIIITQSNVYPSQGLNPTTGWMPGQILADHHRLTIPPTVATPETAHWEVGLWQVETGDHAFVLDANGEPVAATVPLGTMTLHP